MASLAAHHLAFKPAVMDMDTALAYSGLALAVLREASKDGKLRFKAIGPRGRLVCATAELDAFIARVFADSNSVPLEDFDFGADEAA